MRLRNTSQVGGVVSIPDCARSSFYLNEPTLGAPSVRVRVILLCALVCVCVCLYVSLRLGFDVSLALDALRPFVIAHGYEACNQTHESE